MKLAVALVLATLTLKVSAQPQMSEACKTAFSKCGDNKQDHEKMRQCMEQNGCTMPAGGPQGGGMPGGPGGNGGMPQGGPGGAGGPGGNSGGQGSSSAAVKPKEQVQTQTHTAEVKADTTTSTKPKPEEATGESASKVNCAQVTDNGRQNPKAELGESKGSHGNDNSASAQ